jgi:hypothetical protein
MRRLTLLLGGLILLCVLSAQWIVPQQAATIAPSIKTSVVAPVKLTPFTLKTGSSRAGRNTSKNDKWISQPVLKVENTSGKAIKFLMVEVSFPGSNSLGTEYPFLLTYGQAPGQKPALKLPETIKLGEKVNLTVLQNASSLIRSRLLDLGIQPPFGSQVTTKISGIIFVDGTAWFNGAVHVPDPDNSLRWHEVGKSPGSASLNSWALFKMASVGYQPKAGGSAEPQQCYDSFGYEWVTCCDFEPFGNFSAILEPARFGTVTPVLVVGRICDDPELTCEWYKASPCN